MYVGPTSNFEIFQNGCKRTFGDIEKKPKKQKISQNIKYYHVKGSLEDM